GGLGPHQPFDEVPVMGDGQQLVLRRDLGERGPDALDADVRLHASGTAAAARAAVPDQGGVPPFARGVPTAAQQLPVHDDPGADAGAEVDGDELAEASPGAEPQLT